MARSKLYTLYWTTNTGRHTLELASRGYRVTGVDITGELLEDARERAMERSLEIAFEERDMRDLDWTQEVDAVLCMWGSFGYFDSEGDFQFARAASRALKMGGRFPLDTHVVETLLPTFQPHGWSRIGTTIVLEKRYYNHLTGRIEGERIFIRENHNFEVRYLSIRLYSYHELSELLWKAGFEVFSAYESLKGEPFQLGSPRLYLVATKVAPRGNEAS
jgi:SAM-dependent methyltransferase